jgi:hypothetical protein
MRFTMKKIKNPILAEHLEQIPNIGERTAQDLKLLGISKPKMLRGRDPYKLYVSLCKKTKIYHDPCTLDVFISAVRFMGGEKSRPWWKYTEERKTSFHEIYLQIKDFKRTAS